MIVITPLAWLSGLTASLIFLIMGWPLANLLSLARVLFASFQMKLILAATVGAVSAPVAEHHAPQLERVVEELKPYAEMAQHYWQNLSDELS